MRFAFWASNSGPWDNLVDTCQHVEATGWDGIYYADHFMPNQADNSGPTNECWTTLAGLAAVVPRVRLGALVSGNTYRHPAVLAKMAANIDLISGGGRLIFGLGAGWQENEHRAYGIEFSTLKGRLDRFEEACQVVKALCNDERASFQGKYYQLDDAPLNPKPAQMPLLVGGGGEKRTMRIAAKFADEWNVWGRPDVLRHKIGVLEAHCADLGRDPSEIKRSCQALTFVTDDPAMIERAQGMPMAAIAGSPTQLRDIIAEYQAAGVDEYIFPGFALPRGDAGKALLDTFINEVAADFR
jgi:F420-dependent oxidoreductase-like protein